MSNKQYLALSIGPIVKILKEARKTRELWATSYILSTLMKHLMEALDPADDTGTHPNILIPSIPKEVREANLYGAGIYPDLLFMEAEGKTREYIEAAKTKAIEALAKDCLTKEDLEVEGRLEAAVKFWKQYMRICYVLKELPNIEDGRLSLELKRYLESAELEETFLPTEPEWHALYELFDENRIYNTTLSEALRGDNQGVYGPLLSKYSYVPSTYEIAAMELHQTDSIALQCIIAGMKKDSLSEEFYTEIEKDENSKLAKALKPRHKYYCIVRADGDSIGAAIKMLGPKREDYINFSELLAKFGKEAAKVINDYGGKPIYIGGDDLLFLAPMQNGTDTVFDLITKIDDKFLVNDLKKDDSGTKASLSYGLNIAYYKYPLFEAIDDSFGIMLNAKAHETKEGKKKNAVSFHFTKHSGGFFDATFSKDYLALINNATQAFNTAEMQHRKGLVSSLIFKIRTLEALLTNLVDRAEEDQLEQRLGFFFDKYFEEWKGSQGFEKQKKSAKALLYGAYQEVGKDGFLDLYYATMRLIDFINEPNQHAIHDTQNQSATAG